MTHDLALAGPIDVFLIDPPWPNRKGGRRKVRPRQGRDFDYPVLEIEDIFALLDREVWPHRADPHVVFIWATEQFVRVAEDQMEKLGYRRHARLIWDKGNGVAPAFTVRYSHEFLLWYYRPKFVPVAEASKGKRLTVFREGGRQHSRKPEVVYEMIEEWYPTQTRADIFSRQRRDGWQVWGDEVGHFEPVGGMA